MLSSIFLLFQECQNGTICFHEQKQTFSVVSISKCGFKLCAGPIPKDQFYISESENHVCLFICNKSQRDF